MTNYDLLLDLVRANGMDPKWSKMFVKKLADDEKAFATDEETKHRALKSGFYPGRVELYGLTSGSYKDYLPDYSYFMIHPINHHFKIWVNDKLTLKYVLNSNGCESSMPEYYLYVENNGCYTYLMDAPNSIKRDENFILNLLKEKGSLAAKPNSGTSGGSGFMKLEWLNDIIYINNEKTDISQFNKMLGQLQNHIVTEYAHEHSELAKIWSASECTLRVIMIKLPSDNLYSESHWQCIVSYARFGSSISGGASNLSSGGIGIGFSFETGQLKDFGIMYRRFSPDGKFICHEHPDTKAVWKDCRLPNWDYVKKMIEKACQHIGSLDYLGFDIIITPTGLKFCEINTHPAVDYEQVMCGPVLANENARRFFEHKGLGRVNNADFFDLYLECQE